MQRRRFVTSAIAMAGAALSGEGRAMVQTTQEFYQLRKYTLTTGPQLALTQSYFEHALIPALNQMSIGPVGAFKVDIGPETPTYYLLIPASSVETLAVLRLVWRQTLSSAKQLRRSGKRLLRRPRLCGWRRRYCLRLRAGQSWLRRKQKSEFSSSELTRARRMRRIFGKSRCSTRQRLRSLSGLAWLRCFLETR